MIWHSSGASLMPGAVKESLTIEALKAMGTEKITLRLEEIGRGALTAIEIKIIERRR